MGLISAWRRPLAGLLILGLICLFLSAQDGSEAAVSVTPTILSIPSARPAVPGWPEPSLEISWVQPQVRAHPSLLGEVSSATTPASREGRLWTFPQPTPPSIPVQLLPLKGRVSQAFGCSPYYTGIRGPGCPADQPWFHDGLDIAAPVGTPVPAVLSGTVIFAGADDSGPVCGEYQGYGLAVVVDSGDGRQALYAHLSKVGVTIGQRVSPDTIIGQVGATGCVTGPHLHFGLRYSGELVDPTLLF
jgi:murein DD-endopeptidase MepM/ murein hydrolase activator NlpD